jgi:hypothetical protein
MFLLASNITSITFYTHLWPIHRLSLVLPSADRICWVYIVHLHNRASFCYEGANNLHQSSRNGSCRVVLYKYLRFVPVSTQQLSNVIHISLCSSEFISLIPDTVLHVPAPKAIIRRYNLQNKRHRQRFKRKTVHDKYHKCKEQHILIHRNTT